MGTHAFFDQITAEDVFDLPDGGVPGGWVDCSAMSTAAAINAAAAAAPAGSTIWLGPRPSSAPLVVTEPLIYQERQRWLGAGGRSGLTIVKAGAGLASGLPIMAATGWYNNAGDADEAVVIEGIKFDLDSLTGRHGLIVYNFWSTFRDLHFVGAAGSTAKCLLITDKTRNGSTISSNSHSENTFEQLRFDNTTGGAGHFYQESLNSNSNQDGHLVDSFFSGCSGTAVLMGRAAGWTIENNHFYGTRHDAISANACYATKIQNNYIEDFGVENTSAAPQNGYYSGITAVILNGKPSIISGNTVSINEPATIAWVRATCIAVRPGSGQLLAKAVITDNAVAISNNTPVGTGSEGFRIGEGGDTGRQLEFSMAGNLISPRAAFASQIFKHNTTCRQMKEPLQTRSYTAVTGTITLDNQYEMIQNFTCTGNVTVDPPASSVHARDGEPMQLRFLASGAQRTITFNASMRLSTGIASRSFIVPSGEILAAAIEWSSLVTDYIITAATISAN
jgi:hypothetical protein